MSDITYVNGEKCVRCNRVVTGPWIEVKDWVEETPSQDWKQSTVHRVAVSRVTTVGKMHVDCSLIK